MVYTNENELQKGNVRWVYSVQRPSHEVVTASSTREGRWGSHVGDRLSAAKRSCTDTRRASVHVERRVMMAVAKVAGITISAQAVKLCEHYVEQKEMRCVYK